jgi:hypothetical protein
VLFMFIVLLALHISWCSRCFWCSLCSWCFRCLLCSWYCGAFGVA